ncbi:MAG: hypothetical protein NT069_18660 [Planctomycetota bacterium]|nr:hypothetical protein [Planctomycetota bacterium]
MSRRQRVCPQGDMFHVLNRTVAGLTIFEKPGDDAKPYQEREVRDAIAEVEASDTEEPES